MKKVVLLLFQSILLMFVFSCHIDDKIHSSSKDIDQSKKNEVYLHDVKSFKIANGLEKHFLIENLKGWVEYQTKYKGEKLLSVNKKSYNLILNLKINSGSKFKNKNYNQDYAYYYGESNLGTSYAGYELNFDDLQLAKPIIINVREYQNNNVNQYKIIGQVLLYLQ